MTRKNPTPAPAHSGPAFIVWFVPEREGAPWTRLGALWPTKSGKGYRMSLELMPVTAGNTLILPNEPRTTAEGEGA
jgi:hypothetical protein